MNTTEILKTVIEREIGFKDCPWHIADNPWSCLMHSDTNVYISTFDIGDSQKFFESAIDDCRVNILKLVGLIENLSIAKYKDAVAISLGQVEKQE